jgi:hypothetical protein
MGAKLVADALTALDQQTVIVPGTAAADSSFAQLAESPKIVLAGQNGRHRDRGDPQHAASLPGLDQVMIRRSPFAPTTFRYP